MTIDISEKTKKVINKLVMLDENGSDFEFQHLTQAEREKIGFYTRDFGMDHWDWPQGVGIFGLSSVSSEYEDYIIQWAETEIQKGLPLMNINTACPLLTLMDYPQFEELALEWCHNIYHNFERTTENGLQHNTTGKDKQNLTINSEQIWADTIFMTVLFLGKMGVKYQNKKWIEEAIYQVFLHTKYLLDRKTCLFYHGWDFSKRSNFGGNLWCRGNSWFTLGIPLFCQIMSKQLSTVEKKYLLTIYKNQIEGLISLCDKKEHIWHTILNDPSSYIETSGSAGILSGIYLGLTNGYLVGKKYEIIGKKGIQSLLSYVDETGTLTGVSAGTAISEDAESYKNIIRKPMVYGQALCLFAINQYKKYTENY